MSDVIDANIEVHTKLAAAYNTDEPHFLPENKEKVRERLKALAEHSAGNRLIDLGCGTGFIIDLAKDFFDHITGVDVTVAMLEQVDTQGHDIQLHLGQVEDLPFEDASFDAASAYSFLDHLEDPSRMLNEASRVLKVGSPFYIDLVPNRFYWESLSDDSFFSEIAASEFVIREHKMVTENDKQVEAKYGINAGVFRAAEPSKESGGVDPFEFQRLALSNGFNKCEIHFDWFLGNAKVIHQQSFKDADTINQYLQECLPVSKGLYKYVWFELIK